MKKLKEYPFAMLFIFIIISISIVGITLFVMSPQLPPTIGSIFTVSITVLTSIFSIVFSEYIKLEVKIKNDQREKKIPVYEELLNFIFTFNPSDFLQSDYKQLSPEQIERLKEEELLKFANKFSPKFIAWGADEVLVSFFKYRQLLKDIKRKYKGHYTFDINTGK